MDLDFSQDEKKKFWQSEKEILKQRNEKGMNYTYLVCCRDKSLYCGWTNHLEERVKAHNEGKGAKYTRCRRPVELVYYEEFSTKEEAMRREYEIKKLTRVQKLQLIAGAKEKQINKRD